MIYTSYFYAVRFMPHTMLPVSTALFDPKWFHMNRGQHYIYRDRRGVLNGVRSLPLVPGADCKDLCDGKDCLRLPSTCGFLKTYQRQLEKFGTGAFDEHLVRLQCAAQKAAEIDGFDPNESIDICFLFHEKPDQPCSERVPFHNWLRQNEYLFQEFDWQAAKNAQTAV